MKTNIWVVGSLMLMLVYVSGCASESNSGGLTEREVGGLAGAGIGAGTGAIIGSATGNAAAGTAIGGPIGLVTGALVGESMRRNKEQAKDAAREEVAKQLNQQPLVSAQTQVIEAPNMYNPKTRQTFPSEYRFDPRTGERLEPVAFRG